MDREVSGLVLAAGRSERMGRSKALLELEGRSFLEATVVALREGGCQEVLVVVAGPEAAAAGRSAGARVVEGHPDGEQIDSLRAGLGVLGRTTEAVVVLPVDHPGVRPATVAALLEAAAGSPEAIVRPVYRGRPGHPTVFPRPTWRALGDPDLPDGARSVVEGADRRVDVDVDDAGVVTDIDTPEAYRRYREGGP